MNNACKKVFGGFIAIISALVFFAPSASNAVDLVNANHKVQWPSNVSNKVGDTTYILGKTPFQANVKIDFKNIQDLSHKYVRAMGVTDFFRPGITYWERNSRPGNTLDSDRGKAPSRNVRMNFDFRGSCGERGAVTTWVELKRKGKNEFITLHQGSRTTPHAGGIDPVAIDCEKPEIISFYSGSSLFFPSGSSPRSFDHRCLPRYSGEGTLFDIPLELMDDIGISKVIISANTTALRISPARLTGGSLGETTTASGKKRYSTQFTLGAVNKRPINNIKMRIDVLDFAGQHQKYDYTLSVSGIGADRVNVTLHPYKSVGERMHFAGFIDTRDCSIKRGMEGVHWEIHKLSSKSGARSSIIKTGRLRINNRRTPFLFPFNNGVGRYQLQLNAGADVVYKSPVISKLPQLEEKKARQIQMQSGQQQNSRRLHNPNRFQIR